METGKNSENLRWVIRVDPELHAEVKQMLKERRKKLSDMTRDFWMAELEKHKQKKAHKAS